jgi:hypothetical protein
MVAGGGQAGVGVDPAFYEVTSAGPVPAGGTARSEVSGYSRDMRFGVTSGRFRTLSPKAGTTGGFIRLRVLSFAGQHHPYRVDPASLRRRRRSRSATGPHGGPALGGVSARRKLSGCGPSRGLGSSMRPVTYLGDSVDSGLIEDSP